MTTCYFGADNALEQINFLQSFLLSPPKEQNLIPTELLHLDIYFFNMLTKMYKGDADLIYFAQLINEIRSSDILEIEVQAVLAFVILFDHDITTNLTNLSAICDINSNNQLLLEYCNHGFTVQELTSNLLKMSVFSS